MNLRGWKLVHCRQPPHCLACQTDQRAPKSGQNLPPLGWILYFRTFFCDRKIFLPASFKQSSPYLKSSFFSNYSGPWAKFNHLHLSLGVALIKNVPVNSLCRQNQVVVNPWLEQPSPSPYSAEYPVSSARVHYLFWFCRVVAYSPQSPVTVCINNAEPVAC